MIYSALSISQYIINYEWENKRPPNNFRLQKLLYFVQGFFYIYYGHKCFCDKIIAADFGPIVSEIYEKYKKYGSCIIIDREDSLTKEISSQDKEIINFVLELCSKFSNTKLLNIVQNQNPWKSAYIPYLNKEIKEETIKKYFVTP